MCSIDKYPDGRIFTSNCNTEQVLDSIGTEVSVWLNIEKFKGEEIPMLPDSVRVIILENSKSVKGFIGFPSSLKYLKISNCKNIDLSSFPPFPSSLEELEISHCNLKAVSALPANLTHVSFANNKIQVVPASWPPNIETLDFRHNRIQILPSLPPKLVEADFTENPVQIIPRIPEASPILEFDITPLKEPFQTYYMEYQMKLAEVNYDYLKATPLLKAKVNAYWDHVEMMKQRARNLQSLQLVSGDGGLVRTTATGAEQYIPNISATIGAYLSGEKGSVPQQMRKLKTKFETPPKGGKRKTRRRTTRKN